MTAPVDPGGVLAILLPPGSSADPLDGLSRPVGDSAEVRSRASVLAQRAVEHRSTADYVTRGSVAALSSWTGAAAAGFADYSTSLIASASAADLAYQQAATALSIYADDLDFAQECYDCAVRMAHDPATVQLARTAALRALCDAGAAADRATASLTAATAELQPAPAALPPGTAPPRPSWLSQGPFVDGLTNAILGTLSTLHDLTTPSLDPAQVKKSEAAFSAVTHDLTHPVDFAKDSIDWQDLSAGHYAYWLGELTPSVLAALLTHEPVVRAAGATLAGQYLTGMADVVTQLAKNSYRALPPGLVVPESLSLSDTFALRDMFSMYRSRMLDLAIDRPSWRDVTLPRSTIRHILYGDGPGSGGHLWPGQTGKTPFPLYWSAHKILLTVQDILDDPTSVYIQLTGPEGAMVTKAGSPVRFAVWGNRGGYDIRVIISPGSDTVEITAHPVELPPGGALPRRR